MKHYSLIIDGAVRPASAPEFFPAFNPRTGEPVHLISQASAKDVNAAVASALAASTAWGRTRPLLRGRAMHELAALIRQQRQELASLESLNTGKSAEVALREMDIAAEYFEFFGNLTSHSNGDVVNIGPNFHCFNKYEPYGVVGVITPWNLPLNQFARSAAAALAAGNTVVVKPSEHTSASTLELVERIYAAKLLPPGVVNVVTGMGATGAALAEHPGISKVSFTGSVATGRRVGAICAQAIKPVTLELGGKSPNIVLADADVERAVDGCIKGFTANAGQVCIAGSRIFVHASIYQRFKQVLCGKLSLLDANAAQWAPIITQMQFDKVLQMLSQGEQSGLSVLYRTPATAVPAPGWFVPRVVFEAADENNPISTQEVFGPVAVLRVFSSLDECAQEANATCFGLAAGIWGKGVADIHALVNRIDAGQIFVNGYFAGGVENSLGGFKNSGIGKEKGIAAYLNYQRLKNIVFTLE